MSGGAAPLSEHEFARLMAPVGPFEPAPALAIAVSGGSDSLALTLLADAWARGRGGGVHALTVEHGLRPESAAEARQVHGWLASHDIAHAILPWRGPKPTRALQATARAARYDLLGGWCQAHGILHLLLAHHLEDQAETFLLRLGRGSGLDGLAAMAAIAERPGVRLLRPLLGVHRARLAATLARRGQDWIEDPSNRRADQARARLRAALPALGADGLAVARLAATAQAMGRARAVLEGSVAEALVRAAWIHPAGYAEVVPEPLMEAPPEVGLRALGRCLAAVGGAAYPPRLARLERFHAAIAGGLERARTLGGCRIVRHRGRLLICREPAAARQEIRLVPGAGARWDGRFEVAVAASAPRGLTLRCLGREEWRRIADAAPWIAAVPPPARAALPAVWRLGRPIGVPVGSDGFPGAEGGEPGPVRLVFKPPRALGEARFAIVSDASAPYL